MFKYLTLILILFSACAPDKTKQANEQFLRQYGPEVQRINTDRQMEEKKSIPDPNLPAQYTPKIPPANTSSLPQDMFDINYLAENYPNTYYPFKLTFDDIRIPGTDDFGVKTGVDDKYYLLVDGRVLQRNVDYLNKSTTHNDREIRLKLVKEQKALDRKMMTAKRKTPSENDQDLSEDEDGEELQDKKSDEKTEKQAKLENKNPTIPQDNKIIVSSTSKNN
jgi:hypothetical protein